MASITGLRFWPRWIPAWLLKVQNPPATQASERPPRAKRFYPTQRDAFIENAALAREMYRL